MSRIGVKLIVALVLTLGATVVAGTRASGPPAGAGAGAPEPLDPAGAVRVALENHPLLTAAGEDLVAAEADLKLARSGYLPRVDLTEDFARSTNPVFVFASKLGQERFTAADFDLDALNRPDALTNSATRVALRQNLWDAGRTRLGNRAATLGIDAATATRERTEQEVAFGALRSFWDLVLAQEMLAVARDAEKAAEANLSLASELVDTGLAVPSDRMSAEVRLAQVRAMRVGAEEGVEVARAALDRALGLPSERTFEPRVPEPDGSRPDDSLEARLEQALGARADLLTLERRIDQARIGEKVARSTRLPELGLGAQYEWNGDTLLGTDGSNWSVGVGLRLALFDGFETRARVARAQATSRRLEALRQALEQGIRLQVRAAWAERVSAAERLAMAESALEQAGEALRIVRERYGEGLAVMVELLAAEAAQTRARADRAVAWSDVRLSDAALDLASGRQPLGGPSQAGTRTETR